MRKLLPIFIIAGLAYYVSDNWYQLLMIRGASMMPSYHNLQIVLLDRHSSSYGHGDVIAFECEGLGEVLVKRVAACPGDSLVIRDGRLYVNERISGVFSGDFDYAGIAGTEIELRDGQYFVIGDNIAESRDSRYEMVGLIEERTILGKII